MMDENGKPKFKMRWSALLWILPVALFVLVVGAWAELPWALVLFMVAVPVAIGLLLAAFGDRRTSLPGNAYGITSQGARSEGRLELHLPVEQIPQAVKKAVQRMPHLSIVSLSDTGAEVSRSISFKSWGARITLQFRRINPQRTEVIAWCEPKLSTTVIDYGQGAQDVNLLLEEVRKQASQAKWTS